ncbi:tether containing ubx domain for glut4 [Anaeramoeba ignava]|uniref:Tether containing ubx domain for glut4 n=1 Tax=Anaeramoeba ignava TaxID=1746090 RepID=A0A9Q0RJ90_ANAIG|nr:tether containing ubx domain for glut4 [Anaeramoeba ignava]
MSKKIQIALQIDQQRYIDSFNSNETLWDIIEHFDKKTNLLNRVHEEQKPKKKSIFKKKSKTKDPNIGKWEKPSLLYINKKFSDPIQMMKATLRSIGISSGSASFKKEIETNQTNQKKEIETNQKKEIESNQTNQKKEIESNQKNQSNEKNQYHTSKISIFFPKTSKEKSKTDFSPDFFKPSAQEIKEFIVTSQKKREESEMLMTQEMREKRKKNTMIYYPKTLIRFVFPDRILVQSIFSSRQTINDLYLFLKENVLTEKYKNQPFTIYISPPVNKFQNQMNENLHNLKLTPATVFYVSFSSQKDFSSFDAILPDLIQNIDDFKETILPQSNQKSKAKQQSNQNTNQPKVSDETLKKFIRL